MAHTHNCPPSSTVRTRDQRARCCWLRSLMGPDPKQSRAARMNGLPTSPAGDLVVMWKPRMSCSWRSLVQLEDECMAGRRICCTLSLSLDDTQRYFRDDLASPRTSGHLLRLLFVGQASTGRRHGGRSSAFDTRNAEQQQLRNDPARPESTTRTRACHFFHSGKQGRD